MRIIIFCLFSVFIFDATSSAQTVPLLINTNGGIPYTTPEFTGSDDQIVKEAFRRIGVEVKLILLPSERALKNANSGIDDGNYPRISGLSKAYPNLLKVPEKIRNSEFVAFSKNKTIKTNNWESLSPYNVALITGWKIFEKNIGGAKSVTKVKNAKSLFILLEKNRADLVLYERNKGLGTIRELGFQNVYNLNPPLAVKEMFLYLHKKHKRLIPQLDIALRKMKKDGSYAKIVQSSLQGIVPKRSK